MAGCPNCCKEMGDAHGCTLPHADIERATKTLKNEVVRLGVENKMLAEAMSRAIEQRDVELRQRTQQRDAALSRAARMEGALRACVNTLAAQDEFGELMTEEYEVLDAAKAALREGEGK